MRQHRDDVFCHQELPLTLPMTKPVEEWIRELGSKEGALTLQVTKTAKEWAEELGVSWETVRKRRYRGWSWAEALDPRLRKTTFNDRGLH